MADHWRSPHTIADGSSPTSSIRQQTTRQGLRIAPDPVPCRGISDSAVRDFAALVFAAVVFGIPGIGTTILLVGYLLFFA